MSIEIISVDAFTDRPFAGNPAAICLLAAAADAAWMQTVAREMNLSETAFLVRRGAGDGYDLRWFTPAAEVDLCGHATLASAHVLYEDGHLGEDDAARFHTASGVLVARRAPGGGIVLDFPAEVVTEADAPASMLVALGLESPRFVGRNRLDWLVEVAGESELRALRPDFRALGETPARGVMVTARAGSEHGAEYDFVSRYFAPAFGIDEDPVTGSAHCALGPYWASRLARSEVVGFQASARGGTVRVRDRGDRVDLIGDAVTILRSRLVVGRLGGTAVSEL